MSALKPRLLLMLLLITGSVGCARSNYSEVAPVTGRITLDGKPIEYADVTFQPSGKSPGVGRTGKDGRYMLLYKRGVFGAPVGPNRVSIAIDTQLTHGPQTVPAKYNTDSELRCDVQPGPNEFNFDLTTK
jgi:hypothetical protein